MEIEELIKKSIEYLTGYGYDFSQEMEDYVKLKMQESYQLGHNNGYQTGYKEAMKELEQEGK